MVALGSVSGSILRGKPSFDTGEKFVLNLFPQACLHSINVLNILRKYLKLKFVFTNLYA